MPTEHHDEHGLEKPQPHPSPKTDAEHPGYEVTDVNTKGIVVFLAGLTGFLLVFFVLCYAMGKAINFGLIKQDGDEASTNPQTARAGGTPMGSLHRGESMGNNPQMEQSESAIIASSFPTPRLDADDSNQATSDLHAREDLLLDHYTAREAGEGAPAGSVRIPINVAMQLVVKRGLPASNEGSNHAIGIEQSAMMHGDVDHKVTAPLTNGFARTAWDLEQIEARGQKMKFENNGAPGRARSPEKVAGSDNAELDTKDRITMRESTPLRKGTGHLRQLLWVCRRVRPASAFRCRLRAGFRLWRQTDRRSVRQRAAHGSQDGQHRPASEHTTSSGRRLHQRKRASCPPRPVLQHGQARRACHGLLPVPDALL